VRRISDDQISCGIKHDYDALGGSLSADQNITRNQNTYKFSDFFVLKIFIKLRKKNKVNNRP
jgi:hypothetical protein